jgi:RNA polymerase sigma-70 factor (ECF subfamily)
MNNVQEATLVERLRESATRREAFPFLVKEYQRRVYSIVRKMVIDHDDADDIVQEVFVKVWHNLDKFKGESGLFTWIYRIATNESLQFLRKRKNQISLGDDLEGVMERSLMTVDSAGADEIEKKLQKAILKLPDKQRLVFHLKYYEELSYDEIAEITETSVGALKASYHHATTKIEEYLQAD